jgi:hypothetical protein
LLFIRFERCEKQAKLTFNTCRNPTAGRVT